MYRDVRFSNDKTLYKVCIVMDSLILGSHVGGLVSNRSEGSVCSVLSPYSAWREIVHCVHPPGMDLINRGGKWHPDAGHLARIRRAIDRRPQTFKKPLNKPKFRKLFGGVKGLLTAEDNLKTAPKVY
jgi:uncharacterized protein (DUF2461 family)